MRKHIALGLLLLCSAGCESAEAKAARLRQDEGASALMLWYDQKQVDSLNREYGRELAFGNGVSNKAVLRQLDSALTAANAEVAAAQAKHDLAQRALDKFMAGQ